MSAAQALENRIRNRCNNVVFYVPLIIEPRFAFIINRLLSTLSTIAEGDMVEVLYIDTCSITGIPTVQLMLPPSVSNAMVDSLFDETQILLHRAARLDSIHSSQREAF